MIATEKVSIGHPFTFRELMILLTSTDETGLTMTRHLCSGRGEGPDTNITNMGESVVCSVYIIAERQRGLNIAHNRTAAKYITGIIYMNTSLVYEC